MLESIYRISAINFGHEVEEILVWGFLSGLKETSANFPGFNLRALRCISIPSIEGYRSYGFISPQMGEVLNLLIQNHLENDNERETFPFVIYGEVAGERRPWQLGWMIKSTLSSSGNGLEDSFLNGWRPSNFSQDQLPDYLSRNWEDSKNF
jgi:hypothetical protein